MSAENVSFQLSQSEALVLFDFLMRCEQQERLSIEDEAEWAALSSLLCVIERELEAPFAPDYKERLLAARDEIRLPLIRTRKRHPHRGRLRTD